MKSTSRIIATALSTAMLVPVAVNAQEAPEEAAAEDNSNVIIVTATRRAQDVQDIPLAVTAVSPEQLDNQGVVNVQNITSVSPSFSTSQAQNSSGTVVLRIRGVGTTSNNIGFESAVGIFIDGAYQSRPGIALSEFVDVERVEVLRGPQGTLFGRNTSAGALNITNKRPDLDEFGGFVNATYANFDEISVQGAVNLPIVPGTLAARVTGAYRERDGFIEVVNAPGSKLQDTNSVDQFLVRGQLGWETDSGFRGRIIGDYSESSGDCCGSIEILRSPVESAGLFGRVGLGAKGGMFGEDVATSAFDTRSAQRAVDNQVASANTPHLAASDQWGVTGEFELPIGDSIDAIYIGSYREYTNDESYDSDFSALDIFDVVPGGGTSIETMTHELRFQGDSGRLQWMVGGYYSTEDIRQEASFGLGDDYGELVGALFFGPTFGTLGANPLSLFTNSNIFPNSPLNVPGGIDPAGITNTNIYTQNSKSWSIFTHNTFEVTDNLSLTLGARWSDESKDGSFSQGNNNNTLCNATLATIGVGNVPAGLISNVFGLGCFAFTAPADLPAAAVFPLPRTFTGKFKDDELIYTGKLAYDFGNVNAYASFTHGYKAGGFNLDSTAAAGGADPRFASEEVDAYEVGMKGRFIDGAVTANLALFYQEFSNFQVLEFTGAQFSTFNVPQAISQGFELETQIRPDDHLTINAGLTYVDAEYPDDCADATAAVNVRNLCGFSLTNAPKLVTIAGATYTNDIGDSLSYFFNAQIRHEGDRRTSTQGRLVPNAAAINAAGSVDAAIAASPLNPFDVQDSNLKINLRAGIGGINDGWRLEGWVTNLTNEITRGVTFNTVLRSGSRSAFTQQPRRYGLTVRTKF